jgi:hypothetical protein
MEPDLQRKIKLLERATLISRGEIRTSFAIAMAVFIAGVIGAVVVHIFTPADLGAAKFALTICTGFGSFLSGIPIKDVFSKRLRIEALSYLISEYESFRAYPTAPDEPDQQRLSEIEKRFWGLIDKTV